MHRNIPPVYGNAGSVALRPRNTRKKSLRSRPRKTNHLREVIGNLPEGRQVVCKERVHHGREGSASDAAAMIYSNYFLPRPSETTSQQ